MFSFVFMGTSEKENFRLDHFGFRLPQKEENNRYYQQKTMSEQKEIDKKTVLTGSVEAENRFANDNPGTGDVYHPLARFMLNDPDEDLSEGSLCGLVSLLDAGTGQKEFLDENRPHFSKESLKKLRSLSSCDEDPPDLSMEEYIPSFEEEGFPVRIAFPEDHAAFDPEEKSDRVNSEEPNAVLQSNPQIEMSEKIEISEPEEQIERSEKIEMSKEIGEPEKIEESEPVEPIQNTAEDLSSAVLCGDEAESDLSKPETAPIESEELSAPAASAVLTESTAPPSPTALAESAA
ncbi:MAG: hypothetical protein Q4G69_07785, partial [Planctomycetia bacterium]|nr:hypothetical protein [Planctomycetia bacterium]